MMAAPSRESVINAVLAAAAGRPVPPNQGQTGASAQRGKQQSAPFSTLPSPVKQGTTVAGGNKVITTTTKSGGTTQTFSVRVPKWGRKNYNIMRFHGAHKIDFNKWKNVKMQREDNSRHFAPIKFDKDEMPKFGAGSEYGRDRREAARRRKYGMYRKKYRPQDQPWILRLADQKPNKKFKGMNEGGVSDNASFFVFTHSGDGNFDVFPIKQWFNFKPIQTYKSLSAEEAEEEFSRRNKVLNYFTVMVRKRMKLEEEKEEETEETKGSPVKDSKVFKVSEMDDWVDDDDDSDAEPEAKTKKQAAAKKNARQKKKKKGSDEEPGEESDDGDEEGLEVDYISDSSEPSEDEDDKKPELAGVDQEKTGLLESESSEEEEEEKKTEETEQQPKQEGEKKEKKKKKKKKDDKSNTKDESESSDNDTSMPDLKGEEKKNDVPSLMMELAEPMPEKMVETLKRKAPAEESACTSKKAKLDVSSTLLQLATSEGITEEVVRKYLLRKPMTVAELLQKLKPRKNKISNEDMVSIIAHILTKINPIKRTQGSKTYFSLVNNTKQ